MPQLGTPIVGENGNTGAGAAWAGGNCNISASGTMKDDIAAPAKIIIESNISGSFKPVGDIALISVDQTVGGYIAPSSIRGRINGGDAGTNVTLFIE